MVKDDFVRAMEGVIENKNDLNKGQVKIGFKGSYFYLKIDKYKNNKDNLLVYFCNKNASYLEFHYIYKIGTSLEKLYDTLLTIFNEKVLKETSLLYDYKNLVIEMRTQKWVM